MAIEAFLKIAGPDIRADSKGNEIPILWFRSAAGTPGESGGSKQLNPGIAKRSIEFSKGVDQSTPKLLLALTNNTQFREMVFSFVRTDKFGEHTVYYRLTAKLPRITSIKHRTGDGANEESGSKHGAVYEPADMEWVTIGDFTNLLETHIAVDASTDSDSWISK